MRLLALTLGFLLAAVPAWADMYQDASNARNPQARHNLGFTGYFTPADYGAACSGSSDDTAALLQALDAASAAKGVLMLPANQACRYNQTLTVPQSVAVKSEAEQSASLQWFGNATDDHIVVSNGTGPHTAAGIRYVVAGGSGYVSGDLITLAGGCGTVLKVNRVNAGAVTDARISTMGSCAARPSATTPIGQASATGAGSGAIFMMFYGSATTKNYNTSFENITFANQYGTTAQTQGCTIRADYVGFTQLRNIRMYGANQQWSGFCLTRGITTIIDGNSVFDNFQGPTITLAGTGLAGNGTIDFKIIQTNLQGCNMAVTTKAQAQLTGCVVVGDHAGGMWSIHGEYFGGFKGYAWFFDTTKTHAEDPNMGLVYFVDHNVEASGTWSGTIGSTGKGYTNLFLSGSSWITGNNLNTLHFDSNWTQVNISPETMIVTSQTDGSNPSAVYADGTFINIAGELISYTGGTTGVYLGPSSNNITIGGKTRIRQHAVGIQGSGGAGRYVLDASFVANTADLAGINCAAFGGIKTAISSAGTPLCPLTAAAAGMPASCAGAVSGTLWNDAGTVKVCP